MERDDSVRTLETLSVGDMGIAPCIYSGFSILGHHDRGVIAADYELSERLGREFAELEGL